MIIQLDFQKEKLYSNSLNRWILQKKWLQHFKYIFLFFFFASSSFLFRSITDFQHCYSFLIILDKHLSFDFIVFLSLFWPLCVYTATQKSLAKNIHFSNGPLGLDWIEQNISKSRLNSIPFPTAMIIFFPIFSSLLLHLSCLG